MSLVEIKNVSYKYPYAKNYALKDINCVFEKGKFYGIIGENGGGKTSLCSLVRGLIPHFYLGSLEGECIVDGTEIREWDTSLLATKIGYVFQNPFTQISGVKPTVFEEIGMGLENLGVPVDEIIERILMVCKRLQIEDLIRKNPNELSGGQRQRVSFASILVMDTDMLIIDEPTSQLDPEGTKEVFGIIDELKKSGKTILLVEHKMDLISKFCDEIVVMEQGQIAFQGPTKEVFSTLEIMKHGANIPEVAKFGFAMRDAGKGLRDIPINIDEAVKMVKERDENGN